MREARSANVPVEKRAADYLQAAAVTAPMLGSGIGTPACETYNAACGELTVLLQPYDPDRTPLVFVHGLFSTPFDWVQTINGLQADPEIRKHYQFWIFAYPTGNPILYSALRLREELAKADQLYPNHKPYVVVGH